MGVTGASCNTTKYITPSRAVLRSFTDGRRYDCGISFKVSPLYKDNAKHLSYGWGSTETTISIAGISRHDNYKMFSFGITWVFAGRPNCCFLKYRHKRNFSSCYPFVTALDIWYILKDTYHFPFNHDIETARNVTFKSGMSLIFQRLTRRWRFRGFKIYSVNVVLLWTCFLDSSYLLKHEKSYTTKGCQRTVDIGWFRSCLVDASGMEHFRRFCAR